MISHRFCFRTVTNIQKKTNAIKRVSFGIADDKRMGRYSSVRGGGTYVADLVLSHGETYGGDRVAMGAEPIRVSRSWFTWSSRLPWHRVNPVAGEELVFVIDWRVVQKSRVISAYRLDCSWTCLSTSRASYVLHAAS